MERDNVGDYVVSIIRNWKIFGPFQKYGIFVNICNSDFPHQL